MVADMRNRFFLALALTIPQPAGSVSEDLRLFAATFAAGFLFVSILIA